MEHFTHFKGLQEGISFLAFDQGTIKDIWKSNIEMEKWFDPALQEFVDKELILMDKKQDAN